MRTISSDVYRHLATHGVIARREHPELAGQVDWLISRGQLRAMLPGVYVAASAEPTAALRIQAIRHWDPDAILVEESAASLTFWSQLAVPVVRVALKHARRPQPGYAFCRRQVPAELVLERSGLRLTSPPLTALDLCGRLGGEAIDQVLRSRAATLAQLGQALQLTGSRAGNADRRRLLLDSRDEPWSEPERRFHGLLRGAGIGGWRANLRVVCAGQTFFVDIGFSRRRLIIEVDGRRYHSSAAAFESDRRRQNLLTLDGWVVLRFTPTMIEDHPTEVVDAVLRALEMLPER